MDFEKRDPSMFADQHENERKIKLLEQQINAGNLPPEKLYELTKQLAELKGEAMPEAPDVEHEN